MLEKLALYISADLGQLWLQTLAVCVRACCVCVSVCVCIWSLGVQGVKLTPLHSLSQHIIAVTCSNNQSQVSCFSGGPHTRLLSACHVVAFQPRYFQMFVCSSMSVLMWMSSGLWTAHKKGCASAKSKFVRLWAKIYCFISNTVYDIFFKKKNHGSAFFANFNTYFVLTTALFHIFPIHYKQNGIEYLNTWHIST